MSKTISYPINKNLSKYSHIQLIFGTDAGELKTDDEWKTDRLLKEIKTFLPESIGTDDDSPAWYEDKDTSWILLLLHGWDSNQKNKDPEMAEMAFIAVFFDVKNGIVPKIDSEGLD